MKNLFPLLAWLVLIPLAWSCEEENNLDPIGNWELREPTALSSAAGDAIVLNEAEPTAAFNFNWAAAVSSNNYQVRYTLGLYAADDEALASPLLSVPSSNGGKDLQASVTAQQLDEALFRHCFDAGTAANLIWVVTAQSLSKEAIASRPITITRFATDNLPAQLFISGTATEAGEDREAAIPMKAWTDAEGNPTHVFEAYTSLTEGQPFYILHEASDQALVYGGSEGTLEKCGAALTAPETADYRVTVNLADNTYELLKIAHWSMVGDVIAGGWGGDAPLEYIGNGVWQGVVELVQPANFIFRANTDWAYLLKRIPGTENELVMESQAAAAGLEFEDIPSSGVGPHLVTLSLKADGYTYTIEEVDNGGPDLSPPGETPEQLFLLSAGSEVVATFTKDGDVFSSGKFLALQAGEYTLNTMQDGSGTAYSFGAGLGETSSPDADAVVGNMDFGTGGSSTLSVTKDQAYQLTVDFETAKVTWKYYNIKLFHWDEVGGGWDARNEFLMTYVHPYTWVISTALTPGYDMKFNSPWEVQFGADNPSALSGTMTNNGGSNFRNITQAGTYEVTIEVTEDFATGTYSFVKK